MRIVTPRNHWVFSDRPAQGGWPPRPLDQTLMISHSYTILCETRHCLVIPCRLRVFSRPARRWCVSGVPVDLKDLLLLFSPIAAVVGAAWMLQGQLGGIRESLAGISARLTHLEAQQARLDSLESRLREVELKTAK